MTFSCVVSYKYRQIGRTSWVIATTSILNLKSESETLVMQKLKEKHKNCDVNLEKIQWR